MFIHVRICLLLQGGAEVAKYCAAHICEVVKNTQAFKEGDVGLGLKQSFLRIDDMLRTPAGQVRGTVEIFRRADAHARASEVLRQRSLSTMHMHIMSAHVHVESERVQL